MPRLFQPLKWALRAPRSLASRLRWTKPPQPAPRTEVRYTASHGQGGARRVQKLVIGGMAVYSFAKFVEFTSEAQGLEGEMLIPLPLMKTPFPTEAYKGSDPEWREFVKLSKDPASLEKIKRGLAESVAKNFSTISKLQSATNAVDSPWTRATGGGEARVRNWLLNVDYPSFPPPEVGTYGILIDDEAIDLILRRADPATQAMLDQIWWPSTTVKALRNAAAYLFKQSTSQVTQYLGSGQGPSDQTTAPGSPNPSYDGGLGKGPERARNQSASPEGQTNPARVKSSLLGNKAVTASGSNPVGPDGKGAFDPLLSVDATSAMGVFWKAYLTYRPTSLPPPRGCIRVSGLVDLETKKAFITVAVNGWYNPKTGKFDGPSMSAGISRIANKQQSPLR